MYPAILIVDDESTIIDSLEGILSDDGFEVMHAYNGYEALKKMRPNLRTLYCWTSGCPEWTALKPPGALKPMNI